METLITKGKWYVSGGGKYATIQSRNLDKSIVVTYPTIATVNSTFINEEEFRANATLIASAPELLKACENALILIQKFKKGLTEEGMQQGCDLLEAELIDAVESAVHGTK